MNFEANTTGSNGAPASAEEADASPVRDIRPVLVAMRDVAAELMRLPVVANDAECCDILFRMAHATGPDELNDLATSLCARAQAIADSQAEAEAEDEMTADFARAASSSRSH